MSFTLTIKGYKLKRLFILFFKNLNKDLNSISNSTSCFLPQIKFRN